MRDKKNDITIKFIDNKFVINLCDLFKLGFSKPERGTIIYHYCYDEFLPTLQFNRYYGKGRWDGETAIAPFMTEIVLKNVNTDEVYLELSTVNFELKKLKKN